MLYVCKIGLGVIFITPEFEIMSFFCKKVYYMMLSKRQKMITALIAGVVAGGGLCELPHHVTLLCHLDAQLSFAECDV